MDFYHPGKEIYTVPMSQDSEGLVVNAQSTEDTAFQIALQVSDGMETSPAVFLRMPVLSLQLRMINNTGLVLIHKSFSLITPGNLSFNSNSEDENLDRYCTSSSSWKHPKFSVS